MSQLKNICVVGAGQMGKQIALQAALCGFQVFLTDSFPAAVENAKVWSVDYLSKRVAKGKLSQEDASSAQNCFHVVSSLEEAAKDADLVIEAIIEKRSAKEELFRSLDIPVRQLECCSGDLADLKVKSCDIEAWSPRQKKYFEVCSCSNLGDAQARRLKIRVKGADGKTYLPHTLNNTCVAPPRMLIALLENNLQADGSVRIPEALRPYMGGKDAIR